MHVQLEVSMRAAQLASNVMATMTALSSSFSLEKPKAVTQELLSCAVSRMLDSIPYRPVNGRAIEPTACPCCHPPVRVAVQVLVPKKEESAWEPGSPRDVSRCKALLLEVLRRAAHDWVLYRQHRRMQFRAIAEDAYIWLFEEDEEHEYRQQRMTDMVEMSDGEMVQGARELTSFLSICDSLDLDPETVRERVRKMDVRTIIASGRPAETRRVKPGATGMSSVEDYELSSIMEIDETAGQDIMSVYESYGTVSSPSLTSRIGSASIY